MSLPVRRALSLVLLTLVAALVLLGTAGAASERSASWVWNGSVPGDATFESIPAGSAQDLRELAAAGDFVLVATSSADGGVVVGPADIEHGELQPLEAVNDDQPLIAFTSAEPDGNAQSLLGVARSDVDRVEATLADGSQEDLPLNEWRAFSYTSSTPERSAAVVTAYSGGASVGAVQLPKTTLPSNSGSAAAPVYGISRASFTAQTIRISRIDSRTLRPLAGPSLVLRSQVAGPLALSPDQQRLALVTYNAETKAPSHLYIVDLQTMRVLHAFARPKNLVRGLSWPEQNRLIELRQTMGPPYNRNVKTRVAWVVDPDSGARTGTGVLTNKLAIRQSLSASAGLVLLLGTSGLNARADSQVVLVSPDGAVKSVLIPLNAIKGGRLTSHLAVDGATNHAYVVAPGGTVFDIDLNTMSITRHQLVPPKAATDTPAAIGILDAEAVGGKLAVAGVFAARGGAPAQGVVLVDLSDWTTQLVDRNATMFAVSGNRLVTDGPSLLPVGSAVSAPHPPVFHGVSVYDTDGALVAHLYGKRAFHELLLTPGYGHAIYNGPSTVKQVPKIGPPRFVGNNDQLVFDINSGAARGGSRISDATPPLGPPMLIFRGSSIVGEPSDRQPAAYSPHTSGTTPVATTQTTTTSPALQVMPPATQAARRPVGYTVSNLGHRVTPRGRMYLFPGTRKYDLYLLGIAGRRAIYRVQVAPHFRCWGSGDARKVGVVSMLGCPEVVGAYPLQLDDTAVQVSSTIRQAPTYLHIDGAVADGTAKVELRDGGGRTLATAGVTNNLFAFTPPYPKEVVRVVPVDAQGNDLKPHPEWGRHQQRPRVILGPRTTKVLPSKLVDPQQHASTHGVDVTVGHNDVVVVKLGTLDPETKSRIFGRKVGISCFVVSPTIRHTRSVGVSLNADRDTATAFRILGYIKPPLDGCEITGSYGHRWHDQWGTHSIVEVAFGDRGRRFFENRAAARDLALFVRKRDMQQLRKQTSTKLIAAIRKQYGDRVTILASETASAPAGRVGVWAEGTNVIISERSTANGRFYVQLDNGKIAKENVRGLAFVF
jgi:hypothetical protein